MILKKIHMKKILLGISLLLFMGACSDDFVEVRPPYAINSETFFEAPEDYENALVGAYDLLQATYTNAILGEIASQDVNAGGESPTDVIGWQQVDRMIHTPINDNLRDLWNFNFAGVQRASFIIQNEDNIDFEGKAQIIAEARFLRAFFNFELSKWFGPIPIKPEGQFELGEETSIPRASMEEVYSLIESDLQSAIENLPVGSVEPYRVNQMAARALLGKMYLYQEDFDAAATQLEEVINSGQYHLYGTQGDEDFADLFEFEGENGPESVFEVQYTGVQGAGFECLQCSEGNVMVGFSGIRGYIGPVFEPGFGFCLPRASIYEAYDENDLRRDLTILDIESWAAENDASFNIGNQDPETGHTGYFNRKYLPRENDNQPDVNLTQPNNYRAIRYADVLLMAAEALVRGSGSDMQAQEYVNQVRQRAGLDSLESTGQTLLDDIYRERRLELLGEGHTFFDMVRTGRAADEITGFTEPKNNIFPIPQEEIQFSRGNWTQNPGY
jgi:tetratricopeptide (TPR) repeat protein